MQACSNAAGKVRRQRLSSLRVSWRPGCLPQPTGGQRCQRVRLSETELIIFGRRSSATARSTVLSFVLYIILQRTRPRERAVLVSRRCPLYRPAQTRQRPPKFAPEIHDIRLDRRCPSRLQTVRTTRTGAYLRESVRIAHPAVISRISRVEASLQKPRLSSHPKSPFFWPGDGPASWAPMRLRAHMYDTAISPGKVEKGQETNSWEPLVALAWQF